MADAQIQQQASRVPCRFWNHGGCARGDQCTFSHAPDKNSVQDARRVTEWLAKFPHLTIAFRMKNVCKYAFSGTCRFGDARCVYSHDLSYPPPEGWPQASAPVQHEIPANNDTVNPGTSTGAGSGNRKGRRNAERSKRKYRTAARNPRNTFGGTYDSKDDERTQNFGFTNDEVMELLSQGVKPWDEDAWVCSAAGSVDRLSVEADP